jgi:NAD(P)H-hydrate epimerase
MAGGEMSRFLSRDEARALDQHVMTDLAMPGVALMENAGRGVAELLRSLGIQGLVVVCCGRGNNGGDGLVIARHLDNAGVPVRVFLFAQPEELAGDARINMRILARGGFPVESVDLHSLDDAWLRRELNLADWVVDALFGSGLQGPLRPPFDRIVAAVNDSPARVLAVDIPSGLDCDTGEPMGPTVRAHHTATIVAPKKGFAQAAAQPWVGRVHVIDMGMPRRTPNQTWRQVSNLPEQ